MRSNKELQQILLDNIHTFDTGLCKWLSELYLNDIITTEELDYILVLFEKNRPHYKFYHKLFNPDKIQPKESIYWWKMGYIKPRIKFIKKHLK